MDRFSLPFLATLIAERDSLDAEFSAKVATRLRRLRDDGDIVPIKGTGGKGRGKAAEFTFREAAAALILETLAPMNLATEATAAARKAFERRDDLSLPRLPGITRSGDALSSLIAALEGIERGEPWVLRFHLINTRGNRSLSARIEPDEPRNERLIEQRLSHKGQTLLGTIRVPLNVILNPLIEAKEK